MDLVAVPNRLLCLMLNGRCIFSCPFRKVVVHFSKLVSCCLDSKLCFFYRVCIAKNNVSMKK